jgi:hypothetical protein
VPSSLISRHCQGSWVVERVEDGLPVEFAPAGTFREAEALAEAMAARGGVVLVYRVEFRGRRRRRSWRRL